VGGYTEDGDGKIDNHTWSAALTYSVQGHALMAGYQAVSDGSNFVQPNQGSLGGKCAGTEPTHSQLHPGAFLISDQVLPASRRHAFASRSSQ
jgi:hypothetical protein